MGINIPQGIAELAMEEMAGSSKPSTPQEHVDNLNRFLRHSWLQTEALISNFDPPRSENGAPQGADPDKCPGMQRFVFRADAFTSLDGEIVEGGVRIIYNGHKRKSYPEDKAFLAFEPGQVVSWNQLLEAGKQFVFIANDRCDNYVKYYDDPKLLEQQKNKTYKTLLLSDLTQPQRSHLDYRLDHNTCCGYGTAASVARGDHGDMSVKEIFEKYGCRSSRSAAILTGKVLNFRWLQ